MYNMLLPKCWWQLFCIVIERRLKQINEWNACVVNLWEYRTYDRLDLSKLRYITCEKNLIIRLFNMFCQSDILAAPCMHFLLLSLLSWMNDQIYYTSIKLSKNDNQLANVNYKRGSHNIMCIFPTFPIEITWFQILNILLNFNIHFILTQKSK